MKTTTIDRMVDTATTFIAEIYQAPENQIRKVDSRKSHIIYARRMLIFFLNRFLSIKHVHMKNYIEGICHATSIHHCNKMEWFIENFKDVKEKYEMFIEKMEIFDIKGESMKDKKRQLIELQIELNNYERKIKQNAQRI